MSRRGAVKLPAFQVFINALAGIDAYRRWFYGHYSQPAANAAFKQRACLAFAGSPVYFSDDDIKAGLRRWHAEHGDACPPDDVAAFVRFISPQLSEVGRQSLAGLREALRG